MWRYEARRQRNPRRERFLLASTLLLLATNLWLLSTPRANCIGATECLPVHSQNVELVRLLEECRARRPTSGLPARSLRKRNSVAPDSANFAVWSALDGLHEAGELHDPSPSFAASLVRPQASINMADACCLLLGFYACIPVFSLPVLWNRRYKHSSQQPYRCRHPLAALAGSGGDSIPLLPVHSPAVSQRSPALRQLLQAASPTGASLTCRA